MRRIVVTITLVVVALLTNTTSAQTRAGEGRSYRSSSYGSGYNRGYNRGYSGNYNRGGYGNSGLQIYVDGVAVQTGSFLDTLVAGGKIDQALEIARANREKPKPTIAEMEKTVHKIQARSQQKGRNNTVRKENAELIKENLALQSSIIELQIQMLKLQREILELQKQISAQQK